MAQNELGAYESPSDLKASANPRSAQMRRHDRRT